MEKYRERYSTIGWKECTLTPGTEELLKNLKKSGKTVALDANGRRSKKEVIEYVLDNLRLKGEDKTKAVIVGDTYYDIDGAKAAGISSIGVLFGYGSMDELMEHGADFIVKSMSEINYLLN